MFGTSWDDPRTLAMLQLAGGLSNGRTFSQGLTSGLAGYAGAIQQGKREEEDKKRRALQDALMRAQIESVLAQQAARKQEMAKQGKDRDLMATLMNPAQMGPNPQQTPAEFMRLGGSLEGVQQYMALQQALAPKPRKTMVTKPGEIGRDAETGSVLWQNEAPQKLGEMIIPGPDGKPMVNPLWVQAKKATQAPGTVVNVGGPKDPQWGTPPKDMVWARDKDGAVMLDQDPRSKAWRPRAIPVAGTSTDPTPALSRMSRLLGELKANHDALRELGGAVTTDQSTAQNVKNRAAASGVGQTIGEYMGTDEQSVRSRIASIQPLLLQEIRKASEMGVRGMDSDKELDFYLKAATSPGMEYGANMAAIAVLDQAYGLGLGVDAPAEAVARLKAQFKQLGDGSPRRVNSIEEAKALPPGTRFVDPNGIERVR